MLKSIKAHACLCVACAPEYVPSVYDEAHEEATGWTSGFSQD